MSVLQCVLQCVLQHAGVVEVTDALLSVCVAKVSWIHIKHDKLSSKITFEENLQTAELAGGNSRTAL